MIRLTWPVPVAALLAVAVGVVLHGRRAHERSSHVESPAIKPTGRLAGVVVWSGADAEAWLASTVLQFHRLDGGGADVVQAFGWGDSRLGGVRSPGEFQFRTPELTAGEYLVVLSPGGWAAHARIDPNSESGVVLDIDAVAHVTVTDAFGRVSAPPQGMRKASGASHVVPLISLGGDAESGWRFVGAPGASSWSAKGANDASLLAEVELTAGENELELSQLCGATCRVEIEVEDGSNAWWKALRVEPPLNSPGVLARWSGNATQLGVRRTLSIATTTPQRFELVLPARTGGGEATRVEVATTRAHSTYEHRAETGASR